MARTKSNKTQDIKLPEYLKLAKGTMWFDNIGENCSNVTLSNVKTNFVGRGHITDDEWNTYQNDGYLERKAVAEDKNERRTQRRLGPLRLPPRGRLRVRLHPPLLRDIGLKHRRAPVLPNGDAPLS